MFSKYAVQGKAKEKVLFLSHTIARSFWVGHIYGGLMLSVSGSARGHCVVFLGKTRNSYSASLYPGVQMGTGQLNGGGVTLRWTSIPDQETQQ